MVKSVLQILTIPPGIALFFILYYWIFDWEKLATKTGFILWVMGGFNRLRGPSVPYSAAIQCQRKGLQLCKKFLLEIQLGCKLSEYTFIFFYSSL